MFYSFAIPLPANTPESSPVTVVCPLYPATINRVIILFPPGCAGLAHVRIRRGLHQVWPTNEAGSFASDSEAIDFLEDYPVDAAPFELKVIGWNDDDAYDHTPVVRFNVLRMAGQGGGGLLDQIRGALGIK